MRLLIVPLLALFAAAPAAAQDRSPAARRTVVDLAYVMGQSHALAGVCRGDQETWWARMVRLRDLEGVDEGFDRQLVNAFNAAYLDAQGRFPTCSRAARAEAAAAAARGRALAQVLASAR